MRLRTCFVSEILPGRITDYQLCHSVELKGSDSQQSEFGKSEVHIMAEEHAVGFTVLMAGLIVIACNRKWITVSFEVQDKVYLLTKSILLLYLTDIFLLMGFSVPFPMLHECSPAGIVVSAFIILVVIMNLVCDYTGFELKPDDENDQNNNIQYVFGFCVSVLWLFIEITGLLLKVNL